MNNCRDLLYKFCFKYSDFSIANCEYPSNLAESNDLDLHMQFPYFECNSYNAIKLVQCHSQSINLSLDSTVPIPVLYTTVYLIVDCVIYVYVINFLNLFSLPPQSRAWTKMMCTVLECLLVKW